MATCPKCNKQLEEGSKFCDGCGAQIFEKIFCHQCGQQTSTEYKFCPNCGTVLAQTQAAETESASAAEEVPAAAEAESAVEEVTEAAVEETVEKTAEEAEVKEDAAEEAAEEAKEDAAEEVSEVTEPEVFPVQEVSEDSSAVNLSTAAEPAPVVVTAEPWMPQPKQKKTFPKLVLFCGIALVALIGLIIALFLIFGGAGSGSDYALYLKDGEMYYTNYSSDEAIQVTDRLAGSTSNASLASGAYRVGNYSYMSADGQTLFYPDRTSDSDDGVTLYYRRINDAKAEPVRIDTDVVYYSVNTAANKVTYLKGSDRILYRHNLEEKEKIASDVNTFYISADGTKLVYFDSDGRIYRVTEGAEDKEKIDGDVSYISLVTDDLKTIYYVKDESLYKKTEGEDREKIVSDFDSILRVYDTGEIYYVKSELEEGILMDYVNDDMAGFDEALTTAPTRPTSPYWWNYSTTEEYNAAVAAYNTAYAEYQEAYEVYNEKLRRDSLRSTLENWEISNTRYSLYYYDGTAETIISDNFAYEMYSYVSASDAAVMVLPIYEPAELELFALSEIADASSIADEIYTARTASMDQYVAVGSKLTLLEQEAARNITMASHGKTIYFLDEVDYEKYEGDLYQVVIDEEGTVGKPVLYDSDVSTMSTYFVSDDQFLYYKDVDTEDYAGELYINQESVDYDVKLYRITTLNDAKTILYFTDWSTSREYGTLKQYTVETKESVKIEDDVHSLVVVPNGSILYLYDYSTSRYEGELYRYRNGESTKIDEEVVAIVPIYSSAQYHGSGYYEW